jgi:trimeric autotransporter adhesin
MSTKTTFKRIALVAVAALGFGVLTSVAPASAAGEATPTSIVVGTIPSASVGTLHRTPITVNFPANTAGSDSFTISVRVTAAPAGSAYNSRQTNLAGETAGTAGTIHLPRVLIARATGNDGLGTQIAAAGSTSTADAATVSMVYVSSVATATAGKATFWVDIMPQFAGTHSVLVSARGHANSTGTLPTNLAAYTAGDVAATYSFATGVSPTTVTLATVTGATVTGATATIGRLMKATLNAGAVLGAGETIALTTNKTTNVEMAIVDQASPAAGKTYAATRTLTSADFVDGVAYFFLKDVTDTASTTVVTATGSGLLSPSVTSTVSSTTGLLAVAAAITVNNGLDADGVAVVRPGSGHVGATAAATFADTAATTATSHSYGLTSTTLTATRTRMTVVDTDGEITGLVGLTYETGVTTAVTTGLGSVSFTATLLAGEKFVATIHSTTPATITVTGATATVGGTTGTVTAEPASTIYATHGTSVVATVLVKDQFGAAVANSPMTVSVTGRNATTSSAALATDATGRASFTLADAGTAATLLTQSVIVFDTALTANTSVTVNYGVDRVTKVALSTPTTLNTAATGITYTDIDASSTAGASTTRTTITATVTDVNGAVLVGVPVKFTTASEGAGILTTTETVYTGSAGTAAASVFGWTAGIKTFTATAGAISTTGTVNYRQGGGTSLAPTNSADEARTISAVRSGNAITVTARDRFGNPVSGVPLWGTRTGNGTFGGGSNTNGQTTGANGTAEFLFNAGSADSVVTITAGSATATPAPCYGQTGDLAGIRACSTAATQTAFTASVAGTATTAEIGVGASFAPAGIGSVTVAVPAAENTAQAAVDAAAEATDAANAATDAANAAAEAADAATAAAQDAADAVAALSTSVSAMISDLKRQITALTNLVIKIQRKVRA